MLFTIRTLSNLPQQGIRTDMARKDSLRLLHKVSHSFAPNEWDDPDYAVLRIAQEHWGEGTVRPGLVHEYHTIFIVRSGSIWWDKEDMVLQPGDALLCRAGEPRLLSCPDEDVQMGICLLQGDQWLDALDKAFPDGRCVAANGQASTEIFPLFDMMLEEALQGRSESHLACRHWLNLMCLRIARQAAAPPARRSRSLLKFQAARQLICDEWRTLPSINEVAERLNISHTYLCRIFRDYEGTTPQNFLLNLRIRASADELARGERSLSELAKAYHFADQFAFSRAFKRVMSEPPSHYAARYQRKAG
jgi:AraC-like DNA-binding protein